MTQLGHKYTSSTWDKASGYTKGVYFLVSYAVPHAYSFWGKTSLKEGVTTFTGTQLAQIIREL